MVDSEQSTREDDNELSFQTATEDGVEFEQDPLTSLSLSHSQDSAALAHHPRAPTIGRARYEVHPSQIEQLLLNIRMSSWPPYHRRGLVNEVNKGGDSIMISCGIRLYLLFLGDMKHSFLYRGTDTDRI